MLIIALMAALALTEPGAAPSRPAEPASASTPEITVYGRIIRQAPALVQRFGHPTSGGRLARWRTPICVRVQGLEPQHDLWIAARMGDIAESVGAPVEPGACAPNIIVVVANPDLALRTLIGKRAYTFLNQSAKPVDLSELAAFVKADGLPAHQFYATGTVAAATGSNLEAPSANIDQFGISQASGAPVVVGVASRLVTMSEPSLSRVVLVLDGQRLKGRSLDQIAAYAALVTLAEVRVDPPQTDPASITALFTDAPPSGLTVWDSAYLRTLYGGSSQINLSMQQSVMADQLAGVLRAHTQPAPAPPSSNGAKP